MLLSLLPKISRVVKTMHWKYVFHHQFLFLTYNLQDFYFQRLIAADSDAVKSVIQEITFLVRYNISIAQLNKLYNCKTIFQKKLAGHPHVINFISACCNDRAGGSKEYLVVTELCSGIYLVETWFNHVFIHLFEIRGSSYRCPSSKELTADSRRSLLHHVADL